MDGGRAALDVMVGGIDVDTGGLQVAVEGQRLVDVVLHDMQPDVLVDATVVAEEVVVVPLVARIGHLAVLRVQLLLVLAVFPAVVDEDGQHVVAVLLDIRGHVETEGHDAILAPAQFLAVQEHAGGEADAFELDEILLGILQLLRQHKVLAIPGRGVGQVVDALGKGLLLVVRVGQGDLLPLRVVAANTAAALLCPHLYQPPRIEVKAVAGKDGQAGANQNDYTKNLFHCLAVFCY